MQNIKNFSIAALVLSLSEVQGLQLKSDPICSSAGCTQYNHPNLDGKSKFPRDYFVPNFGEDFDISASKKHLKEQENKFGVWNL